MANPSQSIGSDGHGRASLAMILVPPRSIQATVWAIKPARIAGETTNRRRDGNAWYTHPAGRP